MGGQGLGGGTRGMKSWRSDCRTCGRSTAVTWNGTTTPTLRPHNAAPGFRCHESGHSVPRESTYLPPREVPPLPDPEAATPREPQRNVRCARCGSGRFWHEIDGSVAAADHRFIEPEEQS